jgi:hypothetical protein
MGLGAEAALHTDPDFEFPLILAPRRFGLGRRRSLLWCSCLREHVLHGSTGRRGSWENNKPLQIIVRSPAEPTG